MDLGLSACEWSLRIWARAVGVDEVCLNHGEEGTQRAPAAVVSMFEK
jgi:hypothetical protein